MSVKTLDLAKVQPRKKITRFPGRPIVTMSMMDMYQHGQRARKNGKPIYVNPAYLADSPHGIAWRNGWHGRKPHADQTAYKKRVARAAQQE